MQTENAGEGAPKKRRGKSTFMVVAALVVAVASSAAGAIFGPRLVGRAAAAQAQAAPEKDKDEPPAETIPLEPLIVDLRDPGGGEQHNLRIAMALELSQPLKEEELKSMVPRARDAAIGYLRSLTYEEATTPAKFDAIRGELRERIAKSVGSSRMRGVLFTDFVVQ